MLNVLSAKRINAIQDLLKELCQENGRLKKRIGAGNSSLPMRNDEVRVYSFMANGAKNALSKMPPDCNDEQKGLALQGGLPIPWSEVLQVPMVDTTIVGTTCVRLKDDLCNKADGKSDRDRFKGHGDQWEFTRPGIYEIEIRTSTQYKRKTNDCKNLPDFTIAKWLLFGGECAPNQGGGYPDATEWNNSGDGIADVNSPTGWSHNQRVSSLGHVPIGGRCFEEFSWKLRGLSCEVESALKQIEAMQKVLCMDEDKLPDGTVVDDTNAQVGGPLTQNPPKSHILTFFEQKFAKLCKDFGVIIDQIATGSDLEWENEEDREAIASMFKDIEIPVADKQVGPNELERCPELEDYECSSGGDNASVPCPECPEEPEE
jgi:hypothetical protein